VAGAEQPLTVGAGSPLLEGGKLPGSDAVQTATGTTSAHRQMPRSGAQAAPNCVKAEVKATTPRSARDYWAEAVAPVLTGTWKKKRTISRLASGPRGSV